MIRLLAALLAMMIAAGPASAYTFFGKKNDRETKTVTPPPALPKEAGAIPPRETVSPTPPQTDPEALKKFKAIQNQENWVAHLKKQLDGETSQLNEMRIALAQSFGLDVKKLEKGSYQYDAKSGKFVEK